MDKLLLRQRNTAVNSDKKTINMRDDPLLADFVRQVEFEMESEKTFQKNSSNSKDSSNLSKNNKMIANPDTKIINIHEKIIYNQFPKLQATQKVAVYPGVTEENLLTLMTSIALFFLFLSFIMFVGWLASDTHHCHYFSHPKFVKQNNTEVVVKSFEIKICPFYVLMISFIIFSVYTLVCIKVSNFWDMCAEQVYDRKAYAFYLDLCFKSSCLILCITPMIDENDIAILISLLGINMSAYLFFSVSDDTNQAYFLKTESQLVNPENKFKFLAIKYNLPGYLAFVFQFCVWFVIIVKTSFNASSISMLVFCFIWFIWGMQMFVAFIFMMNLHGLTIFRWYRTMIFFMELMQSICLVLLYFLTMI